MIFSREKTMANGKILICDFKKLDPKSFHPYHVLTKKTINDEMALCSPKGEIYINRKFEPSAEYLAEVFEILMLETKETLLEYEKQMKQEFPDVQNFKEWGSMKGTDEEKNRAFAMLMVPLELKRRDAEQQYYNRMFVLRN